MKKAASVAILLAPALLAGCSKKLDVSTPPATQATDINEMADRAAPADKAPSASKPAPISVPLLAYAHAYAMELPGGAIRPLVEAHEQACVAAGAAMCQVLAADVQDDQGDVDATLKLQAQPSWLSTFRARLDHDAAEAGGKIRQSGTETEDLSRSIVDSEAAIRAKTTMRDRLQRLLATRPGKLSDLLTVERQLAQVQGEIDTARSELAVMRTRVQTSTLTIQYRSIPAPVSSRAVQPLAHSVNGAFAAVMRGLAFLVSAAAVLAPFFIVGVPVWLFVRWRLQRPPSRAAARSSAQPSQ